jgi:hypothetical protein
MTGDERRMLRRLVDAERRRRVTPPPELIGSRAGALAEIVHDAAAGDPLLALDLACDAVRMRRELGDGRCCGARSRSAGG